jgi:hypothetical protein
VTKRTDLRLKANSKTGAKTSPLATVKPLALFGSPVLLAGEDDAAFQELLSRVCAVAKPVDIIDEMFVADVVSLEWEVLRWRRLKSSLMQMRGLKALEQFLSEQLDDDQCRKFFVAARAEMIKCKFEDRSVDVDQLITKCAQNEPYAADEANRMVADVDLHNDKLRKIAKACKAEELARDYLNGKPSAIKLIHRLLANASLSIDALMVTAPALAKDLDNIERIDHLTTVAETRRNAMLREIDRRRAVLSEALRRQVQEVEGEFEVVEKTPEETKSAA